MSSSHPWLRQRDAATLSSGYSRVFRVVEVLSILTFFGMLGCLLARLWNPAKSNPWLVLIALVLGYVAADFFSGFVHWLGDTWGSPDVPILGATVIRPFREHHVDQTAITRHDFVETNGANCLISLPVAAASLWLPVEDGQALGLFSATFLGSLILWVFGTNQFHKWAHLARPPMWIATLQRWHLILPPDHHAVHHTAPFSQYYCITVGWLNWPLAKMRFFPMLEQLVTSVTGALPRRDDLGDRLARLVLEVQGEQPSAVFPVGASTATSNGAGGRR
jgi:ubiquitin-conjugating enzyme E2 variant